MKKIVIMDMGNGLRMKSRQNAALHCVCGKGMFEYVEKAAAAAGAESILKAEADDVCELCAEAAQSEAVLLLSGAMPFLTAEDILALEKPVSEGADLSFAQAEGAFCNAVCCVKGEALQKLLACGCADIAKAVTESGLKVAQVELPEESRMVVCDRVKLSKAEKLMRCRINEKLMLGGVTLIDPERTYIEDTVVIGEDTIVHPNCTLQGDTVIGGGCVIYPNCRMNNAVIGDGTTVEASVLLDCKVGSGTTVGPNAYLRPKTVIGDNCRIGDFVEVKNANIGNKTKVSHLTYVGDADLGENINLGCGVVFSNYDGKKKYRSTIGDNAFIGCNVNIVSPVNVGEEAYIAAGSTITGDVPGGALAVARERQTNKAGWVEARKAEGKL